MKANKEYTACRAILLLSLALLAACSHVGGGVGASGGSSGHVGVGAGVNVQLYAPEQPGKP